MANLLVEIGNTALKAAWIEGITLGKTFRYQGEKMLPFILSLTEREKADVMAVVSHSGVSPEEEAALEKECSHLIILDPFHTGTLPEYGLPEYLPHDRAASLIAARYLFKDRSCTVFDFGTTMTIDFMDSAGRYLGGNISPGCHMRFMSLKRYSKSLPLVDMPEEIIPEGDSVETSIASGVISGIIFEIEAYISKHPENIVIFTGGDANYFAKRMKNSIFVVSNLVLMGLAIITDEYVKRNLQ